MKRVKSIAKVTLLVFCAILLIGCNNSVEAGTEAKLELAIKYLSENKYEEAILAYQEVIDIDPKIVEAYKGISLAYTMQGENDKAEAILNQGLEQNQDNKYLKLALAGVLIDADKGDQAEKICLELIQKDQNDLQTYKAYSRFLMNNQREQEAIEKIQQLAELNKDDYQIHSLLAQLYTEEGQVDEAIKAIITSLNLQPEQSLSYSLLEDLYKDDPSQMLELAQNMIQEGNQEMGELIKVEALYQIGNYQEILNSYANNKLNARTTSVLARAYRELEQEDKAQELLKSIKANDIKDAGMLAYLAESYLQLGDKEQARTIAMQGIRLDETAVDNYLVMYESYLGEDEIGAKIWLIKYLTESYLSYRNSILILNMAGYSIDTNQILSSEDLIANMFYWYYREFDNVPTRFSCYGPAYMDNTHNIAYVSQIDFCSEEEKKLIPVDHYWEIRFRTEDSFVGTKIRSIDYQNKNIVYKVYNPKVFSIADVQNDLSKLETCPDSSSEYLAKYYISDYHEYVPIISRGNIPLEEHIQRAGFNEEVIFIDIN